MTTIAELATTLQTRFTTTADTIARQTGAVRRRSKVGGAALVQTLVLGWEPQPEARLGQLSQMAALLGVAITPQGLDQRFTSRTADCLEQVLAAAIQAVVTSDPVAVPIVARFSAVPVQDRASIALPAALVARWRGTGHRTDPTAAAAALLKAHVRCDLCTGRLTGPLLTDGRVQDKASALQSQTAQPLPPGALRLADLGYFSLAVLAELDAQQVYFLSRLQVQTVVFGADGARLDLVQHLRTRDLAVVDRPVDLGADQRLPVRLIAVRVPVAVANERRRRLHAAAKKKGQAVSQVRLAWADWTILSTNAPADLLAATEALVLYRARWQIELLFKLWKQHGLIDEWRSTKPWRILCEVYAKLLAVVVQHWLLVVSCWPVPDKSLVKAAQTVRSGVPLLASALAGVLPLAVALDHLARTIGRGCRLNPRRTWPTTAQLLLALAPVPLPSQRPLPVAA